MVPAAEQEQRVRPVAAQEVAVGRLLALRSRLLDPGHRHVDGLASPAEQVQCRREVRRSPEDVVETAELLGDLTGLAEQRDARFGVLAPGPRDAQGADRVALLAPRRWADRAGHLDGFAAELLGLAEHPLEHPDLGERGEDERPLAGRFGRDQLQRPPMCDVRAILVAGRPAISPETLVEHRQGHPVRALVEPGDRRLGERGGADRARVGERGVGRPRQQAGWRSSISGAARRDRPVVELESELEVSECIARGIHGLGEVRRLDRRGARRTGLVRGHVMARPGAGPRVQAGGERGVMTAPLGRQEIGLDGSGDQLVSEADRGVGGERRCIARSDPGTNVGAGRRFRRSGGQARAGIEGDEAVLDGLDQADRQVRLEDAAAATGGAARPRRGSFRGPLEGGRSRRQLVDPERFTGRGKEPQDAPALRGALRQAGHRQLVERACQRRAGELTASGQELLGDERIAA